jgi:hypothetical protein
MELSNEYIGHVAADSRQRVGLRYDVTTVKKTTVHFEIKYHKPRIWKDISARCKQYLCEKSKRGGRMTLKGAMIQEQYNYSSTLS